MNDDQLCAGLAEGAGELGLELERAQVDRLAEFVRLLEKWNRRFNLTGTKLVSELLHAHVLDSLSLHNLVSGVEALDVGTGAGFPGVPLAIAQADRRFVLLDSNGKKTRFLQQAKTELDLQNVMIVHARIEDFQPARQFATVVSRAVASVQELGAAIVPVLEEGGRLLLMKGSEYPEELEEVPAGLELETVKTIAVPGKDLPRHVVIFHKPPSPV